jgi:hypothetical protein
VRNVVVSDHEELRVEALLDEARDVTRLQDYGDDRFLPALAVYVESINEDDNLRDEARAREHSGIVASLASRLHVQEFVRQHPSVLDEQITAPVIIVGLQRTGTSKLFRVIGNDPQWNVLLTWQVLNPVPLGELPGPGEPDPRIAFAEEFAARWAATGAQAAHSVEPLAPEMEHPMLGKSFVTPSPGLLVPKHQAWCETADYHPAYDYLKLQLQAMQFQIDGSSKRWILKTPFHLHNLSTLMDTFPDATLVMTHRHPRSSVASMLRIVELNQRTVMKTLDMDLVASSWLRILSLGLERFLIFRDQCGDDVPIVDIPYSDVVRDSHGVLRKIYAESNMPFTAETVASIEAWERDNPRNKDGKHTYDLSAYGLSEEDIEAAFHDYLERYADWI